MDKVFIDLLKDCAPTFLSIAEMTEYRMMYLQDRDAEAKEKMYKHALLAGVGILSLLRMGVLGLMENRKNDNRAFLVFLI